MRNTLTVPHRYMTLGQVFGRLLPRLETVLHRQIVPYTSAGNMIRTAEMCCVALSTATGEVTERMMRLDLTVLANEHASDSEIYAAIAELWEPIGRIVAAFEALRATRACGNDGIALDLLVAIHRHTLRELLDTLRNFQTVCEDPASAIERLGLQALDGSLTIDLHMNLSVAPQVQELRYWLARHSILHSYPESTGISGNWPAPPPPRKRWYETWWGILLIAAGVSSFFDD